MNLFECNSISQNGSLEGTANDLRFSPSIISDGHCAGSKSNPVTALSISADSREKAINISELDDMAPREGAVLVDFHDAVRLLGEVLPEVDRNLMLDLVDAMKGLRPDVAKFRWFYDIDHVAFEDDCLRNLVCVIGRETVSEELINQRVTQFVMTLKEKTEKKASATNEPPQPPRGFLNVVLSPEADREFFNLSDAEASELADQISCMGRSLEESAAGLKSIAMAFSEFSTMKTIPPENVQAVRDLADSLADRAYDLASAADEASYEISLRLHQSFVEEVKNTMIFEARRHKRAGKVALQTS